VKQALRVERGGLLLNGTGPPPLSSECGTFKTVMAIYKTVMAYIRQSWPDSSLGFQAKALKTFKLLPLFSEAVSALPRAAFLALTVLYVPYSLDGEGHLSL